jgi:riboflavin kinase / FMN adenylyltransferase
VQVWRGLDEVPTHLGRAVATVGVFDGVHRGHQVIVAEVVRRARALHAPSVAITFDPHPSAVVRPGTEPALLTTPSHRAELLGELGLDAVCIVPFTAEFSQLSPEAFVERVLVGQLHAREVVVGANFRFGHRAAGDVALLTELGQSLGFAVEGVGLVGDGRNRWSSTYVRSLIASGDVSDAASVLGRPHRIDGVVARGDGRGRTLGFPTANVEPVAGFAVAADGVYAGRLVRLDGPSQAPASLGSRSLAPVSEDGGTESWPAAISIGTNPTFDGETRRVEAFVLDETDLDLYDAAVGIELVERLRAMARFANADELVAQMHEDVATTRKILGLA